MPRDGSGIYTLPPGTPAVTDTTIESTKYNGFIGDIEGDLNAIRPIIAGGTGGNSPATARAALIVERAMQAVTNFDSHAWETGSFYAAAGATGAPSGSGASHTGTVQVLDVNNIIVHATDFNTGITYTHRKLGGTWQAWTTEASDKVAKAGDTMSGDLRIAAAAPSIILDGTGTAATAIIRGRRLGSERWILSPGSGDVESSGNAGSDFLIGRYSDTNSFIDFPLTISRATGASFFNGNITVRGSATPFMSFTPNFGATKQAQLYQNGDTFGLAAAGVATLMSVNLNNGAAVFTASGSFTIGVNNAAVPSGGIIADGNSVVLRAFGSNAIYFQNAGGTATYGYFGGGGFTTIGLQVNGSAAITGNVAVSGTITGTFIQAGGSGLQVISGGSTTLTGPTLIQIGGSGLAPVGALILGSNTGVAGAQQIYFTGGAVSHGISFRENTGNASYFETYYNNNGTLIGSVFQNTNGSVVYNTTSDERLKADIRPAREAIDIRAAVMGVNVIEFGWAGERSAPREIGVSAQQAQPYMPRMVTQGNDRQPKEKDWMPWQVSYADASPYLIAASQEHYTTIDALNARIATLEERLAQLEAKLNQ